MDKITTMTLAAGLMLGMHSAQALTINDIDLNAFSFDIQTYKPATGTTKASASGTSNGIGWSISDFDTWSVRTVTNGTFAFSSLPVTTDNLHPSTTFTITFDQPISTLLVALSNNDYTDSINFGIAPSDFSGVSLSGTQITLNSPAGGLALFENINSLTITHTNINTPDGFDLAFHVVTAVPEPGTYALWLAGMALVGVAARQRKAGTKA